MKQSLYKVLIILAITLNGCGSDDGEQLGPPEGQLIARVGEGLWTSSKARATATEATDKNIRLIAQNDKGDSIVIVINDFVLGNYPVTNLVSTGGDPPDNIVIFKPASGLTFTTAYDLSEAGGLITINEIDFANRVISGTYEVVLARETSTASDTLISLTNGVFNRVGLVIDEEGVGVDKVSANINDVLFQPVSISGVLNAGDLVLSSGDDSGKSITLTIPSNIETGTYGLGSAGAEHAAVYTSGTTSFNTTSGSLVITSHNTTTRVIIGTFTFAAQSPSNSNTTVNVTNGSFDIAYQ
ncbi:hypothetical protein FNH22_14635 [Fulvivirga sp. M361]|uniref:DUF6252 family protein n=1 Tax=Fulvivirga sp. M361 TaxID=2594266 RepID=UPI00117A79EA|nr:DUF6252 family protein [Fulvivirga sp. M361]TRX58292.1 hypothetical protein FNH22_14635 [Fulvivirga sp. M361]